MAWLCAFIAATLAMANPATTWAMASPATTLAMVGPPAKGALGELIKALDDSNARARIAAARALGNIGPEAKTAVKALEKATKDDDANVEYFGLNLFIPDAQIPDTPEGDEPPPASSRSRTCR